jgi:hypothetical protein
LPAIVEESMKSNPGAGNSASGKLALEIAIGALRVTVLDFSVSG